MATSADVVVAFVPEASMGTAIEVWQAHQAGRIVLTISPMTENWVIRILSSRNFETFEMFERFVRSGRFAEYVAEHGNG